MCITQLFVKSTRGDGGYEKERPKLLMEDCLLEDIEGRDGDDRPEVTTYNEALSPVLAFFPGIINIE